MLQMRLILMFFIAMSAGASGAMASPATDPSNVCLTYAEQAETALGIPKGLLRAIALVESGRNGSPWPWTLNISGKPYYFSTKDAALKRMIDAQGRLYQSMDVGCMQVNVRYHGDNFSSPSKMIDPRTNVFYAASFVQSLYNDTGTWTEGTARYHSGQDGRQKRYVCLVLHHKINSGHGRLTQPMLDYCSGDYRRFLKPEQLAELPETEPDQALLPAAGQGITIMPVDIHGKLSKSPPSIIHPVPGSSEARRHAEDGIARAIRLNGVARPTIIENAYRLLPPAK